MTIKNILIDLDGTLTDPKEGIVTCIRYAMDKMGYPLPEDTALEWCIGPPLKQSLAKLLNTQDDNLAESALTFYRERFARIGLFENKVYPNVESTLSSLQQQGYRLFVATAKPTIYATQILEYFQLAQYFKKIYGSELTGERTDKAELIAYILQQEKLNPKLCIMVGDRIYDVIGAKQNNIQSIAVSYGYGSEEELNDSFSYKISEFSQLINIIKYI